MRKSTGLFLLVVGFVAAVLIQPFVKKLVSQAQLSEARSNIAGVMTAEKSYWEVYGTYTKDPVALAFKPEGKSGFQLFSSRESIPLFLLPLIPERFVPYVSKNSFRVLAVRLANEGAEIDLVAGDEKREFLNLHMSLSSPKAPANK